LGTDFNDVYDGDTSSAEFMGYIGPNSFDPCGLELGTDYYWRIDEANGVNKVKGDVWRFTTWHDLIAWWKLDEGTGLTAYDSAGNNDGTLNNGPVWTDSGIDGSLMFDGVDDYVSVSDSPELNFGAGQSFSCSAWVKYNFSEPGRVLQKWSSDTNSGFGIFANSFDISMPGIEGSLAFLTWQNENNLDLVTYYDGNYNDDDWHMVVGVRDQHAGTMSIYVDAVEVNETPEGSRDLSNAGDLNIGISYSLNAPFNGIIDDVRIYDRALSPNDVADLYASASPVDYYYVDGVYGDDLNDGLSPETAFATIQAGIDTASDGDKVLVFADEYVEELDFDGKGITVQSFDEPAVLMAPDFYGVTFIHGEGPDSVFKNFIVKDSYAGFLCLFSSPTISNVTVVDCNNGVIADEGSDPVIINSIFWNNSDTDLSSCVATYSLVEDDSSGSDPQFVDAGGGDYHLKSEGWRWASRGGWTWDDVTSPCIDYGNPGTPLRNEPMTIERDPDNIYGENIRVNMGAYGGTSQASMGPHGWAFLADLNNDRVVNWLDVGLWAGYWLGSGYELPGDLNWDGIVNGIDYALLALDFDPEPPGPDTTAPTPDPMQWSEVIDANGMDGRPYEYSPTGGTWDYWVVMRADPNTTDASGSWEFYFECLDESGFDSGWMSFPSGPPYTYRVWVGLEAALPWEVDMTPPVPAPYLAIAEPNSPNSIRLIASQAFDASGVEYYFECVSGGGHDSGWQDEPNFVDVNLMPETQYCYRVKARDKSPLQNETNWSSTVCVSTQIPPDTTAPVPNPMQWSEVIDGNGMDGRPYEYSPTGGTWDYWVVMRADPNTTDASGSWQFYFECLDNSNFDSGWFSFPPGGPYTYRVWVGLAGQNLRFRVKARDMYYNETAWSSEEAALP
jgi:hypothetical protein